MRPLLALSNSIDWLNEKLGGVCNWLVLAACVVSAGNAMIRYAFGYSSNSWLELQWYMFAIFVMFGASYTFKKNEHVRVEILYLMLSERGQLWLDLIECYRAAPDSAFQCVDGESRPLPICVGQRVALGSCMSPVRGACIEVCLREALECGEPARRCEAQCRTTPGCEDREQALYKCQLNGPVDCVEPATETRDPSDIPCLAEIGALLQCAMQR